MLEFSSSSLKEQVLLDAEPSPQPFVISILRSNWVVSDSVEVDIDNLDPEGGTTAGTFSEKFSL